MGRRILPPMKMKIFLLAIFVILLFAAAIVSFRNPQRAEECPFCQREVLEKQAFYEDDLVLALYSHKPIVPGHCMIIPKRHVERFEKLYDDELIRIKEVIGEVHRAAQTLYKAKDYFLLEKNGKTAGQSVPHVHFHYFPRNEEERVGPGLFLRFLLIPWLPPISDENLGNAVDPLRELFY
jgi:histidine triad (HIT) family protein